MIIRVFGLALLVVGLIGCGQSREQGGAVVGDGNAAPGTIRVMTFNLWHGGDAGGQPLSRSVEVIRAARADVVGLQETGGQAPRGRPRPDRGAEMARVLGWHYVDQGGRTGVMSRYPIVGVTPRRKGVTIELPGGRRRVHVFNVHFAAAPYQPYQLLGIEYEGGAFMKTEAEAVAAARAARGVQVAELLAEIEAVRGDEWPVFVTGDFNEPSHLDWTARAAGAGRCPIKVEWPASRALAGAGFVDAFRAMRGDEVGDLGHTWTPTTDASDPKDRHDRIDFVIHRGAGVRVSGVEVVGERAGVADVVVRPFPSDHRAVVVTYAIMR